MVLPLQDTKNPLYGLTPQEQARTLAEKRTELAPWDILSLNRFNYTEKQIQQAYRQLALHIHPDKNPNALNATEAFGLITQATEYMSYGLKSPINKRNEFEKIRNNPFYIQYGEEGFTHNDIPTYTASEKKTYENMSFTELATEAQDKPPIPEEVVKRLKQFILRDKSLLSLIINKRDSQNTLLHIASENGTDDFIIWLLEQDTDSFPIKKTLQGSEQDIISHLIEHGRLNVLRFFFQRHGIALFYEQQEAFPIWNYLQDSIAYNKPEITVFLFNEINYLKHINDRTFYNAWWKCIHLQREDCSAITALLLKHNLIGDLNNAFIHAVTSGAAPVAKQILKLNPRFDIEELFDEYINYFSRSYNTESLSLLLDLLDSQNRSAGTLRSILSTITGSRRKDSNFKVILAALTPPLYERLYQNYLLSKDENKTQQVQRSPDESALFYTLFQIVTDNDYETLGKLLAISPSPLFISTYFRHSPLLTIFSIICNGSSINYDRSISMLINLGEPLVSAQLADKYDNDDSRHESHLKYNALHFTCELNFQEHFLHLLKKISKDGLDAICHKKERKTIKEPFKHYYYTALHLALAKNNEEMAIEQKHTKVIRILQLRMLDDYLAKRHNEEKYLSHFTIFGHKLFSFGYFSKTTKIKAAESLKDALSRGIVNLHQLNKVHHGALNQGRLGYIAQLSHHLNENTPSNENPNKKHTFQ